MSLADNILRRRQELEGAFRPRYNPMESVVSALSDIEQQAFKRQGEEAKRKMEAEKFGLEKTETEARTKQLQAQAEKEREDRAALAEERRQRGLQWEAEAAARKQKTEQEKLDEAKKAVFEKAYGMIRGAGLPGPGATPVSKKQLDELGSTVGLTGDEVLAGLEQIETERSKIGAELGLTGEKAKTEQAKQRELDRRRRAAATASAPDEHKTRMQELADRKAMADTLRAEEKLARDRMASGAAGQFALTEGQRADLQKRRTAVLERATAAKGIRDLLAKYPDMESFVGTFDQYISSVRAKFGNKKAAEILSALGRASDEYRTAVTGAAASDKERAMLESRVPNAGDSVAAILGKLSVDDEYFKNKMSVIDGQLSANDIRGADAMLGITSPVAKQQSIAPKAATSAAVTAAPPMSKEEADSFFEE